MAGGQAHGLGLVRLTVAAPQRRIDVAMPDDVAVAELMSRLLWHAGEGAADDGEEHGGWVLHRADGTSVATDRTFTAQQIHDGEVLYLKARHPQWPEPDFDDVVDAIAVGARGYRPTWSRRATRVCGLTIAVVLLLAGLVPVVAIGPPWERSAAAALTIAGLLLVGGVLLSRALSDAAAGTALGTVGMVHAAVGATLVLGGDNPVSQLGGPHLLLGSTALLLAAVIGLVGIGGAGQAFAAGLVLGAFGWLAAVLSSISSINAGIAAVVGTTAALCLPSLPELSIRLAKVPVPELPETSNELLDDEPPPDPRAVFAAVARADELLTGLVTGVCAVVLVGVAVLVARGGFAAEVLAGAIAGGLLLRARTFATVRHRVPLLVAGLAGLLVLAAELVDGFDPARRLAVALVLLVGTAAVAAVAGLTYSRRSPTPYLGRMAEILDGALVVVTVPFVCSIIGLFGYARGFFG